MKTVKQTVILLVIGCVLQLANAYAYNLAQLSNNEKKFNSDQLYAIDSHCTKAGLMCKSCKDLINCIQIEPGKFLEVLVKECDEEKKEFCLMNQCSTAPNPQCAEEGASEFECHNTGVYPDPVDCRVYHMCVEERHRLESGIDPPPSVPPPTIPPPTIPPPTIPPPTIPPPTQPPPTIPPPTQPPPTQPPPPPETQPPPPPATDPPPPVDPPPVDPPPPKMGALGAQIIIDDLDLLTHIGVKCDAGYGYNPVTTYCDKKLANGVCLTTPVPGCKELGQMGALVNTSIFFVCMEDKNGNMVPNLFMCPAGTIFSNGTCS